MKVFYLDGVYSNLFANAVKSIYLLLLAVTFLACGRGGPSDRLNVLFISIEDAMPSFGCYGDPIAHTPRIDRFAAESVLFEDVHCQVALCTPSRSSLLTGIRPSTSRLVKIDDDWQAALPQARSLPRHFREHGYYTALAGKIHDYRCGGMDSAYVQAYDSHGVETNELPLQALTDAVAQDGPFFLAVGYSQAHDPWTPTKGARQHYRLAQFSAAGRTSTYKNREYDQEGIRALQRDYYGEITDVDSLIGDLLARVKTLGLFDNTIILVGAMDHGYNFGYRGRWGKGNNFDNETRVPLLIRVPGNPRNGERAAGLVELVDLYPTLTDLCSLPPPPQPLEGYSLRGLLDDPARPWKKAAFTHRAYAVDIVGVKTTDFTLIDYRGDSLQLFDRIADPNNLVNIAAGHPAIVEELTAIHKAGWQKALPEQ